MTAPIALPPTAPETDPKTLADIAELLVRLDRPAREKESPRAVPV